MLNIFFVLTHSFPPEQCSALNKNSLLGMDSLKKKKKNGAVSKLSDSSMDLF